MVGDCPRSFGHGDWWLSEILERDSIFYIRRMCNRPGLRSCNITSICLYSEKNWFPNHLEVVADGILLIVLQHLCQSRKLPLRIFNRVFVLCSLLLSDNQLKVFESLLLVGIHPVHDRKPIQVVCLAVADKVAAIYLLLTEPGLSLLLPHHKVVAWFSPEVFQIPGGYLFPEICITLVR